MKTNLLLETYNPCTKAAWYSIVTGAEVEAPLNLMRDVRYYNRVLSPEEISNIMKVALREVT